MTTTKIIVVEDERIVAFNLKQQLSRLGYDVAAIVASGEKALGKIAEVRPDLILMDIHIDGDIDGIETASQIPTEFHIPVIYVTAYAEQATLERARGTKPYGYLVKPFSERELHATIQMALERHQSDSALRESQDEVKRERDIAQSYLDVAAAMILVLDADAIIKLINRHGCNLLGYANPAELIGKSWIDLFIPKRMEAETRDAFQRTVAGENSHREFYTTSILTRTGEERILSWHTAILTDAAGRMTASLSSGEDVTERKQTEDDLRASEERFRSIFSAVSDGIFIADAETGRFTAINEAGAAMFGYTVDELIGRDSQALSAAAPLYIRKDAIGRFDPAANIGSSQRSDWHCKAKDGRLFWGETSIRFAAISNQSVVIATVRDVTERRAIEAQLRQAQKMEAIGQLTGGIAHDFNNLLAIVYGNLEFIKERTSDNRDIDEMMHDAITAVERGAALTHQLLAYSRQQPLTPQIVKLDRLVLETTKLLRRTLGETIEIKSTMPADLWTTRIDPNQLENALLNLAINARHAMPDGGKLTIEGANRVLDEGYAAQNPDVTAGSYVLLAVTDNGSGMAKNVLDRVLEPFFTTKAVGQGSGLGLSMVYGFVKQSGGHLKIYSEPGHGTTINLFLPKAGNDKGNRRPEAPATSAIPRAIEGEVVMVIEDDEMVRKFVVRALTELGYRIIQASDGPSALGKLDDAGRIDLLLTDVALPKGMSGPEIVREAQIRRPGLRALFMSGYAKEGIVNNGMLEGGVPLLTKPFPKDELAKKVREIIGP